MNKEVQRCLLCGGVLQDKWSWWTFMQTFSKMICAECDECFVRAERHGDEHIALYQYNEAMKDYMQRYKFQGDVVLAKVFRESVHSALSKRKEIIVPIPMHPEKLKERTFAQVDELLRAARISFIHVLEKVTTETQVGKSRQQRMNVPQLFRVIGQVEPRDYLVVDDMYTTGTTIVHAKRALLEAGARSVQSFSLTRGM